MFHYSIAKYVDNIIVNESINVGIIVSVPNTNKYIGKFIEIDKLKNIYPHANLNLLKKVIETFKKYKSSSSLSDLNKFTNQLRFTSPHVRDASDINTALNELFDKFVVIDNNFPTLNAMEFTKFYVSRKKLAIFMNINNQFERLPIKSNKKIIAFHSNMHPSRTRKESIYESPISFDRDPYKSKPSQKNIPNVEVNA